MILKFGLEFDEKVYNNQDSLTKGGHLVIGKKGLLEILERYTGTLGPTTENNFLRVEQYRQSIKETLSKQSDVFYATAFHADELATAETLLGMRDELLLSGMEFDKVGQDLPSRIEAICQIEKKAADRITLGVADRFCRVSQLIYDINFPFEKIIINEPRHLLPFHLLRVFDELAKIGIQIEHLEIAPEHKKNDLSNFRHRITNPEDAKNGRLELKADGSLIIIRSKRETAAGSFLSKICQKNPDYQPLCLIPEKNRALDNAIIQEGVPSLGILSASLGRPSLQILKLVTAFLWEPIDPYKILEFLSLPLKPIHDKLAIVLGRMMAQSPGIKSEFWYANISRFFNEIEEKAKTDNSIDVDAIRDQYNNWFERKRHDIDGTIPVVEVIQVFRYIQIWAGTEYENLGSKKSSLITLKDQAKKIVELLEELPEIENKLSYLNLERIVRTVYRPATIPFKEAEVNHLPFIYQNSATTSDIEDLLWWNFTDHERDYFFSKWYPSELTYFKKENWQITTPTISNQLALWQRNTPIARTTNRIVFIIPEKVSGKHIQAHSLEGDLKAAFGDLTSITYDIETEKGKEFLSQFFNISDTVTIDQKEIGKTKAFIQINLSDQLKSQDSETFTSLDNLFYYPYKWLFKYKIDLHKSSILSVVKEHALKGNLAHKFFEQMLREDIQTWKRSDVDQWLDNKSPYLLQREGAVLLMYGKEPEKVAFMHKVKHAAWSLIDMIQRNHWKVHQTEMDLSGKFLGKPVKGKADLVLEREGELAVVDLKWGGKTRRMNMIKSKEDLQLVMYSKLLTEDHTWAHTSYFIISNAEMVSRNNLGFKEAIAAMPEADYIAVNEEIWSKMEKTYAWRMKQFREGKIEIRTKSTLDELNEIYVNELMDILEMKEDNSPYDDYGTLINLIE